jgi:hypothetical protein
MSGIRHAMKKEYSCRYEFIPAHFIDNDKYNNDFIIRYIYWHQ